MAKSDSKTAPQLDLRPLQTAILAAALPRVAHVIRPYPADASAEDVDAAVRSLRDQKLVQGGDQHPNLTATGVELARKLAAKD